MHWLNATQEHGDANHMWILNAEPVDRRALSSTSPASGASPFFPTCLCVPSRRCPKHCFWIDRNINKVNDDGRPTIMTKPR
ncbi:hypothetical protein Q1695_008355 [Nippostrongylus brasiliensis]|nr:hypothetical protein Q1695_008355 [Nippostrongylus brasiliensis]